MKPKKPPKQGAPLKDVFGNEVPARCRDAYGDTWIQEAYDLLAVMISDFRKSMIANRFEKRKKHYPFFEAEDFMHGLCMIDNTIDKLIEHLKVNRPAGVCPACKGEGCCACRMSGMVPRETYHELIKKAQ